VVYHAACDQRHAAPQKALLRAPCAAQQHQQHPRHTPRSRVRGGLRCLLVAVDIGRPPSSSHGGAGTTTPPPPPRGRQPEAALGSSGGGPTCGRASGTTRESRADKSDKTGHKTLPTAVAGNTPHTRVRADCAATTTTSHGGGGGGWNSHQHQGAKAFPGPRRRRAAFKTRRRQHRRRGALVLDRLARGGCLSSQPRGARREQLSSWTQSLRSVHRGPPEEGGRPRGRQRRGAGAADAAG
jgi:hypothetical protein